MAEETGRGKGRGPRAQQDVDDDVAAIKARKRVDGPKIRKRQRAPYRVVDVTEGESLDLVKAKQANRASRRLRAEAEVKTRALRAAVRLAESRATSAERTADQLRDRLDELREKSEYRRVIHDPQEMLRAIIAQRHLSRLRSHRAMHELSKKGASQTAIAKMADVSQAHVSRTLDLLVEQPHLLESSPQEVGWQHAVGEISTNDMLHILTGWPYSSGRSREDAYEQGSFDQLTTLLADGFLTEEQFATIYEQAIVGAVRVQPD